MIPRPGAYCYLAAWEIQKQWQHRLARGWLSGLLPGRSAHRRLKKDRLCFGKINILNYHSLNSAHPYGPLKRENTKYLDGLNSGVRGGQLEMEIKNLSSSSSSAAVFFVRAHTYDPHFMGSGQLLWGFVTESLSLTSFIKKRYMLRVFTPWQRGKIKMIYVKH